MQYCTKCGKELLDESVVCPQCGCQTQVTSYTNANAGVDLMKFQEENWANAIFFLGMLNSVLGFILYIIKRKQAVVPGKMLISSIMGSIIGLFLDIMTILIAVS